MLARLRSELADAEERRRRAEQRIDASRTRTGRPGRVSSASSAPPEEGFGVRAERLLRLAEQEAAEVRSGAAEEAAMMRQRVREDIERQRHEAEQALIMRSTQFDERAVAAHRRAPASRAADRGAADRGPR